MDRLDSGYNRIKYHQREAEFKIRETRKQGSEAIGLILKKIFNKRKAGVLYGMAYEGRDKEITCKNLRRTVLRCLFGKLRHYFEHWKNRIQAIQTTEWLSVRATYA